MLTKTLVSFKAICFFLVALLPLLSVVEAHASPKKPSPKLNSAPSTEILVDAIIASVDGKPITLSEVEARLTPTRRLTLKEAALDFEVRGILDELVLERLLEEEGERRHLRASDEDVNNYVEEVAKRNQLSLADFRSALEEQGKNFDQYKRQIKLEILRSKLSSQITQEGSGVSDEEVQKYLSEHPEMSKSGAKVKLRQIFIGLDKHDKDEALERANQALEALKHDKSFSEVAAAFSEGPEAANGGLLGVVADEDLSPQIFDVVFPLKDGELSPIVSSADGLRIFKLEERFVESEEDSKKLAAEVRKFLAERKMQSKLQDYFTIELPKEHTVDKKI